MALGRFGAIALLTVGGMLLKKTLGSQQQNAPQRVPMGRTGDVGFDDGRDATRGSMLNDERDTSRVPVLPR